MAIENDDELAMLQESIRQRRAQRAMETQDDQSPLRDVLIGVGSLGYGLGTGNSAPALAQNLYDKVNQREQNRRRQEALESNAELSALSALARQREASKQKMEELPLKMQLDLNRQLSLAAANGANQQQLQKMRAANDEAMRQLMGEQALTRQKEVSKQKMEELPLRAQLELDRQLFLAAANGANQQELQKMKASNEEAMRRLIGDQNMTRQKLDQDFKMKLQELAGKQKLDQTKAQGQTKSTLGTARRNQVISNAGQAFDKDKILTQINQTNNSLDRATSIMDGSTPITGKNFALLQQDMINAMAPGGSATEGKVNREMVETLASKINDLQTRFGYIKDLRKEQPEIFNQLRSLINQVKEDYNSAGRQRVAEISANYKDVPDQAVLNTVSRKAGMLNEKFKPSKTIPSLSLKERAKAILEQRKKSK